MVYGAASNNSACIALQTTAEKTCVKAADYCGSVSSTFSFATTLIALPIIVLAGELFLEGTTKTVLMLRDLGKWCRKKNEYRLLEEESGRLTDEKVFFAACKDRSKIDNARLEKSDRLNKDPYESRRSGSNCDCSPRIRLTFFPGKLLFHERKLPDFLIERCRNLQLGGPVPGECD